MSGKRGKTSKESEPDTVQQQEGLRERRKTPTRNATDDKIPKTETSEKKRKQKEADEARKKLQEAVENARDGIITLLDSHYNLIVALSVIIIDFLSSFFSSDDSASPTDEDEDEKKKAGKHKKSTSKGSKASDASNSSADGEAVAKKSTCRNRFIMMIRETKIHIKLAIDFVSPYVAKYYRIICDAACKKTVICTAACKRYFTTAVDIMYDACLKEGNTPRPGAYVYYRRRDGTIYVKKAPGNFETTLTAPIRTPEVETDTKAKIIYVGKWTAYVFGYGLQYIWFYLCKAGRTASRRCKRVKAEWTSLLFVQKLLIVILIIIYILMFYLLSRIDYSILYRRPLFKRTHENVKEEKAPPRDRRETMTKEEVLREEEAYFRAKGGQERGTYDEEGNYHKNPNFEDDHLRDDDFDDWWKEDADDDVRIHKKKKEPKEPLIPCDATDEGFTSVIDSLAEGNMEVDHDDPNYESAVNDGTLEAHSVIHISCIQGTRDATMRSNALLMCGRDGRWARFDPLTCIDESACLVRNIRDPSMKTYNGGMKYDEEMVKVAPGDELYVADGGWVAPLCEAPDYVRADTRKPTDWEKDEESVEIITCEAGQWTGSLPLAGCRAITNCDENREVKIGEYPQKGYRIYKQGEDPLTAKKHRPFTKEDTKIGVVRMVECMKDKNYEAVGEEVQHSYGAWWDYALHRLKPKYDFMKLECTYKEGDFPSWRTVDGAQELYCQESLEAIVKRVPTSIGKFFQDEKFRTHIYEAYMREHLYYTADLTILFLRTVLFVDQALYFIYGADIPFAGLKHGNTVKISFAELMCLNPRRPSVSAVRKNYRELSKIYHADKCVSSETPLSAEDLAACKEKADQRFQSLTSVKERLINSNLSTQRQTSLTHCSGVGRCNKDAQELVELFSPEEVKENCAKVL